MLCGFQTDFLVVLYVQLFDFYILAKTKLNNMSPTGHFAIGFASKKYARDVNVLLLLVASFSIDIVYFVSQALGGEIDGLSYSHNLLGALLITLLGYLITLLISKKNKTALILAAVIFSHWILDFIVWQNLQLLPHSPEVLGLGVYTKLGVDGHSVELNFGTIFSTMLELLMLTTGVWIYIKERRKSKNA